MPGRFLPVAILFLAGALTGRAQCTLEGKVALPKSRGTTVVTERYEIISKGGILATRPPRAVVYLEGHFPRPASLPVEQVAQKNLAFDPPLLPIRVGTKVTFPNFDDTYHNIFSYSPAKRFDLGRYPPGENPPPFQVFDKPGLVTLRCDIHEHMRGLILVLDTPYYILTDSRGSYRLTNLPAGHFLLKAWIDSRTTRRQTVDLKPGTTQQVDLP